MNFEYETGVTALPTGFTGYSPVTSLAFIAPTAGTVTC